MNLVVCAAQVPLEWGGAEVHVEGLISALRQRGHQVGRVALPFKWYPREQLLRSALAWRLLDLTHWQGQPVDRIICTKFPSYAAYHPHKVVWLIHQFRQVYDWYGTELSDFTEGAADRQVSAAIRALDGRALGEARQVYTNSGNTAARLWRFNRLRGQPLYPPVRALAYGESTPGDFLLSVGRLDRAKRVDLLLRALARTERAWRVVVAGEGPARGELEALTASLKLGGRVEFRGRVPDQELARLYATCRAVYFAPVDEDFGYITVEAFLAGKPVLTCEDSGGVLEFVRHERTGLVAAADAARVAATIDRVFADGHLYTTMVAAVRAAAPRTSWDEVVDALTA